MKSLILCSLLLSGTAFGQFIDSNDPYGINAMRARQDALQRSYELQEQTRLMQEQNDLIRRQMRQQNDPYRPYNPFGQ
jgi:hypothetical protein